MNAWRISDEVRRQIAATNPSIGRIDVAAMFGVSDRTVTNIRREFGVDMMKQGAQLVWGEHLHVKDGFAWPLRPRGVRPLAWATEGGA